MFDNVNICEYAEVETWWAGCFRVLKIAQKRRVLERMPAVSFLQYPGKQGSKQHLGQSMAAECYIKGVLTAMCMCVCVCCRGRRHDRGRKEGRTGTRMPSAHTTSKQGLRDKSDKDATLCAGSSTTNYLPICAKMLFYTETYRSDKPPWDALRLPLTFPQDSDSSSDVCRYFSLLNMTCG